MRKRKFVREILFSWRNGRNVCSYPKPSVFWVSENLRGVPNDVYWSIGRLSWLQRKTRWRLNLGPVSLQCIVYCVNDTVGRRRRLRGPDRRLVSVVRLQTDTRSSKQMVPLRFSSLRRVLIFRWIELMIKWGLHSLFTEQRDFLVIRT